MSALTEFLFPAPAKRSVKSIVAWWEKRRLPYNLAVGAAGTASITWIYVAEMLAPGGGPLGWIPWQPIVAFGVAANICYLLGPAAEILIDKLWGREVLPTGPVLYRMGLTFSVGLALLPGLVMTFSLVIRTLLAIFGA
jgi:hypothetical protein